MGVYLTAHAQGDTLHPSQGLLSMEGNGPFTSKKRSSRLKAHKSQFVLGTKII